MYSIQDIGFSLLGIIGQSHIFLFFTDEIWPVPAEPNKFRSIYVQLNTVFVLQIILLWLDLKAVSHVYTNYVKSLCIPIEFKYINIG